MRLRRGSDDAASDVVGVTLGAFSYLVLVILDLATTTVLLRGYPGRAGEANGVAAGLIESHGFGGLWAVKLAAAALLVAGYAALRARYARHARHARRRGVLDVGLVASCVVQGAVVLVNIGAFVALAA